MKKKSRRKPGGQPGYPPHLKQLLPAERVTTMRVLVPAHCGRCQAALPGPAQPGDPEPRRFQTIELPVLVAKVTEYQGQGRTCPACGQVLTVVQTRRLQKQNVLEYLHDALRAHRLRQPCPRLLSIR